jgi:hypothetical protein
LIFHFQYQPRHTDLCADHLAYKKTLVLEHSQSWIQSWSIGQELKTLLIWCHIECGRYSEYCPVEVCTGQSELHSFSRLSPKTPLGPTPKYTSIYVTCTRQKPASPNKARSVCDLPWLACH